MKPFDFCQHETLSVISSSHPCRSFAADNPLPHQKTIWQLPEPYFWGTHSRECKQRYLIC